MVIDSINTIKLKNEQHIMKMGLALIFPQILDHGNKHKADILRRQPKVYDQKHNNISI